MSEFTSLVKSMRLRTLPLSLAGVLLGMFVAISDGFCQWPVIVFLLLTTVSLQILSNLSNELGDFLAGTDLDDRHGSATLQHNELTPAVFKKAIIAMALVCMLFGLLLVWTSFDSFFAPKPLLLLLLGACAIWAAVRYTLGKNPYGYRGLGDVSVFVFFGLVSVCGAYFVFTHSLTPKLFLLASAMGFFSVGVLNVNNIRDMATDSVTRVTVPLKLGERKAKIYHSCLIIGGWICLFAYACLFLKMWYEWLFVLTLPLYVRHLIGVWKLTDRALDPMLPLLVVSSFLLSILFGVGLLL